MNTEDGDMFNLADIDGTEPRNTGNTNRQGKRPIGQILAETAGLRPDDLANALERQAMLAARHRYYLLGRILVSMGYVSASQVSHAIAIQQSSAASEEDEQDGTAGKQNDKWKISTESGPVRPVSALQSLAAMDKKVSAGELESMLPLPLGFDPLDEALGGGIRSGELLLLGGSQGVGKTTMAFQMARNIAASEEANCLYVCFEHDEENLTQRLLAMESIDPYSQQFNLGLSVRDIIEQIVAGQRHSNVGLYDVLRSDPRSATALERLSHYGQRLFLLKGSGTRTTLEAISALIESRRVRRDERLVLFVDYLQKVPVLPEAPTEQERVTRVVEGLKEIAMAHQIPVVAVVASDREGLKAKRMRAHHLAGGSALAYEADIILMLSDKFDSVARVHIEFNPHKAQSFRDWVVCSIEKNRAGRDIVDMEFEKRFNYCCLNPNGNFVTERLIDDRLYVE